MRPASMREKSSSVLTSLSRRSGIAMRQSPDAAAVRGGQAFGLRQRVFQRPQHQRERRAELVAHVGEEGGLGAIDLGERLGALALFLVGARVGDRSGELTGQKLVEAAIGSSSFSRALTPATRNPAT